MNRPSPFPLLLLLLLLFYSFLPTLQFTLVHSNYTHILQDILKEISERQNWDFDAATNSTLRVSEIRFGTSQKYDFRIRFGKTPLLFKFPDEVDTWNKLNQEDNFGSFVKESGSTAQLDTLKLDGPFDLRVGGLDELALSLPLNVSHNGLKRLLVGEGITVVVRGAEELSLFHTFDHNFTVNGSDTKKRRAGSIPFWHSWCMPLLPIHVIGSASLIAYRTNNPDAPVETTLLPEGTIELLPAKCYKNKEYKNKARISHFLISKIDRLGKLLRIFLSDTMLKDMSSGLFRVHVKASTIINFRLEVEKNIGSNETVTGVPEEWRTRPTVERLWFEVMARIEAEKLRPIMVKKVRPFIAVDSDSWSNLMFNISFTKFPSILVPSEALTLDVKW
ncbi:protein TUNICAMYCIN INDUCED 1 [Euphorbia lathyris]|uniref:protein TUNICAMYCIN INDUCED 1 n=1 Tax=Euphorbia lathyris TaxID=212925 RepID=UPI00331436E5